jgi:hypothetical protein
VNKHLSITSEPVDNELKGHILLITTVSRSTSRSSTAIAYSTPTSTATPTQDLQSGNAHAAKSPIGVIGGCIIGCVAFGVLAMVAGYFLFRRFKSRPRVPASASAVGERRVPELEGDAVVPELEARQIPTIVRSSGS